MNPTWSIPTWTMVVAGGLALAGASPVTAQTVIVEESYAPPIYDVAPPVYAAPVIVAPAPRVYVAPAPVYVPPIAPARRFTREVVVTGPAPAWVAPPAPLYADR